MFDARFCAHILQLSSLEPQASVRNHVPALVALRVLQHFKSSVIEMVFSGASLIGFGHCPLLLGFTDSCVC